MEHLPSIQASEQSAEATMVALGTGSLSESSASDVKRMLAKQMDARQPVVRAPSDAELAAIGIKVIRG